MKPILTATTSKQFQNQKGFSLVEILVTMMLVVTIFTLVPLAAEDPDRERLEDSFNTLNRIVRFSVNESILRNVLVRIRFNLETSPVEYSIEYGSGAEVILPQSVDYDRLSYSERELQEQKEKKFNAKFQPVSEFGDGPQTLPKGIEIYAIGTTYNPKLMTTGEASIYFYPTGEKDSSFIIFNSEYAMGTFSIAPFEDVTNHQIIQFDENEINDLDNTLESKAKEEFEKWLKD